MAKRNGKLGLAGGVFASKKKERVVMLRVDIAAHTEYWTLEEASGKLGLDIETLKQWRVGSARSGGRAIYTVVER